MVYEASVAQNKVFDLDDHIKVLSLTEVLEDVFTTSSLDFPITEFRAFELETETAEYATTASTYVADGVLFQEGTVTDTETLTVSQETIGDIENVTNLYFTRANTDSPLFTAWASGYENQAQGIGFEIGDTTSISGSYQSDGTWLTDLEAEYTWFADTILTDLNLTAVSTAVDNYIQGVWVQDQDRDGT